MPIEAVAIPRQSRGFISEPLKAVGSNLGPPKGGYLSSFN